MAEKKRMFAMRAMRRPWRSASRPKINAPMGRVTRLAVMVRATAGIERPNSFEIAETVKTRTKKSNASKVQPRNPAMTA